MSDRKEMSVRELKQRLADNADILVINTYMMEAGFNATKIEPAIPMFEFVKIQDSLDREQEIVFY